MDEKIRRQGDPSALLVLLLVVALGLFMSPSSAADALLSAGLSGMALALRLWWLLLPLVLSGHAFVEGLLQVLPDMGLLLKLLPGSIVLLVEHLPKAGGLRGNLTLQPGDSLVDGGGQQLVSGGSIKAVFAHPPLRLSPDNLKGTCRLSPVSADGCPYAILADAGGWHTGCGGT